MKQSFIHDDFLLETEVARRLYHEVAKPLPIIDYHNHLSPKDIASNRAFENLTQIWLEGDHYKWRAMRAAGIDEHFITGEASDKEKFLKWAETVPKTLRNPLFHWTHLELKRYFGIDELLTPENAASIFDSTKDQLQSEEFAVQGLLDKMNVEVICTTDDPVDSLESHRAFKEGNQSLKLLPTFRPDKFMEVEDSTFFLAYLKEIEEQSNIEITNLDDLLTAIKQRYNYFESVGCMLSDHGLSKVPAVPFTKNKVESIFQDLLAGKECSQQEKEQFKGFLLQQFAMLDYDKNWVMQLHIGPIRNTNSRLLSQIGRDAGTDSIGDFQHAESLQFFLDLLDSSNSLPKSILYNVNPADNEVFATMAGNFNDGSVPGKIQWGSAWWFLDQLDGMTNQINTLSNIGLLSTFIGMLTDSRSFLSFPRHEYFRRLLCSLIGHDVEKGLLPNDESLLSELVGNVCYFNAKKYFGF
ncbi:MAG: glucuronate isomerase [Balneola sp.]|nr:MAG: glucuronate isomerase [Balneola sp.]